MSRPLVLAIDQGTGSTKALVVDRESRVVARGQCPLGLITPQAGWVEQDAEEIWRSVLTAIGSAVTPELSRDIVAIGLSTQRESCLIWDRATGRPLTPLLSWQDQRTLSLCQAIPEAEQRMIRARTGLPLDPMFSAVKAQWLLDRIDPDRSRAKAGEICVGTIDSFLIHRLGGGHVVELGNASRMQLVDLDKADYDRGLLGLFNIPAAALPRIVPSSFEFVRVKGIGPVADGTPVTAVLADSHAALFAHGAFEPGKVKATQGTGSSVMGLYDSRVPADRIDLGVCRTIAWQTDAIAYAFEGNIRSVGSTLVWLADLLGIDTEALARLAADVPDSGGVAIVPAFGGLGSPYWDAEAVGLLGGIVLGTSRAQVARAAVDSIAHQIVDVLDRVRASGLAVERLYVDGGPTKNDLLMQFEADMAGVPVARPVTAELSALGAAHLAGVGAGIWTFDDLKSLPREGTVFQPAIDDVRRQRLRTEWRRMVARSRGLPVNGRTDARGAGLATNY
jgi:glycerol kinase